jgi:hypothetical protein
LKGYEKGKETVDKVIAKEYFRALLIEAVKDREFIWLLEVGC